MANGHTIVKSDGKIPSLPRNIFNGVGSPPGGPWRVRLHPRVCPDLRIMRMPPERGHPTLVPSQSWCVQPPANGRRGIQRETEAAEIPGSHSIPINDRGYPKRASTTWVAGSTAEFGPGFGAHIISWSFCWQLFLLGESRLRFRPLRLIPLIHLAHKDSVVKIV